MVAKALAEKTMFTKWLETKAQHLPMSDKDCVEVATLRFYRRAAGRITKREATKLGRLYGKDLHWKWMGKTGDKLENRRPVTEVFASYKKWHPATWREEVRSRHIDYYFYWYGPRYGEWPGSWPKF